MHGLLRQWLRTLSAKRQKRHLEKQPLQKSEGWSNPEGAASAATSESDSENRRSVAATRQRRGAADKDWSRDQFDTPTAHFERVPCGYVPKEGETLYECFVGRYSSGVWRVTRKAEVPKEERTC